MAEQQVCNINFYLYMTLLFGFNHSFRHSKRVQWLAKAYSFFVSMVIVWCTYIYAQKTVWEGVFLQTLLIVEYISYVFISMTNKNNYLQKYYKKMKTIDNVSNTRVYKILFRGLLTNVILMFLCKLIVHSLFYYIYMGYNTITVFMFVFEVVMYVVVVCGRLPLVFVFSLLYCRVRYMKTTLERNQFNCTSQGDHHPRRYIQMYQMIMDTFEETDNFVKFQLFIFNILSVPYYVTILASLLEMGKADSFDLLYILWILLDVVIAYTPMVTSAILSDLISDEVEDMLGIVLERRIESNNERDRAEIQKLFESIKSRPFNYTVWRVIPLNIRSMLSFMSFCLTTIIAVLQIKGFNAKS